MKRQRRGSRKKNLWIVFVVCLTALLCWAVYDLYGPRTAHLREFDPDAVARLETAMWRSYYEKQRLRLFNELSELLRTQYNMPVVRSNVVAYYAANAAFVFKKGKQHSDYEQALPDLIKFYQSVRNMSDIPFDAERAARLELEWWIVHRERAKHPPGDLDRALAALQTEIYGMPIDRLMEHGRLRAEAMTIRDTKAEAGGVTETDWEQIDQLLHKSWRSLAVTVKSWKPDSALIWLVGLPTQQPRLMRLSPTKLSSCGRRAAVYHLVFRVAWRQPVRNPSPRTTVHPAALPPAPFG